MRETCKVQVVVGLLKLLLLLELWKEVGWYSTTKYYSLLQLYSSKYYIYIFII